MRKKQYNKKIKLIELVLLDYIFRCQYKLILIDRQQTTKKLFVGLNAII